MLVAALLHDVGKSRARLKLWERVAIVLVKAICPDCAQSWGVGPAAGWRRPFVVSALHPQWGAELAAEAGASPLTQVLIRRHQEDLPEARGGVDSLENRLLSKLRSVDDES